MANYCVPEAKAPNTSDCYTPRTEGSRAVCPECGRSGKEVQQITVEHLLKEDRLPQIREASYFFCETPACDVVYFSSQTTLTFRKTDLRVRVGLKETEDPIPVCYCFGYTERMIFEEVAETGRTAIPEKIRVEVQAGNCEYEIRNPQGTCCLGSVSRVVKRAKAQVRQVAT